MINIETRHLEIVKTILRKYPYDFFVFGSRITERVKLFSDLDLLYFAEIPQKTLMQLEEDFEESDLPYKVDLLKYEPSNLDLQQMIGSNYVRIQCASEQVQTGKIA